MKRDDRALGIEVNMDGVPVSEVVFYGEPELNVINVEIPTGLENPRWDFIDKVWREKQGG